MKTSIILVLTGYISDKKPKKHNDVVDSHLPYTYSSTSNSSSSPMGLNIDLFSSVDGFVLVLLWDFFYLWEYVKNLSSLFCYVNLHLSSKISYVHRSKYVIFFFLTKLNWAIRTISHMPSWSWHFFLNPFHTEVFLAFWLPDLHYSKTYIYRDNIPSYSIAP